MTPLSDPYHPAPLLRAVDPDAWTELNEQADIREAQEQERADSILERRNQEDDDAS